MLKSDGNTWQSKGTSSNRTSTSGYPGEKEVVEPGDLSRTSADGETVVGKPPELSVGPSHHSSETSAPLAWRLELQEHHEVQPQQPLVLEQLQQEPQGQQELL